MCCAQVAPSVDHVVGAVDGRRVLWKHAIIKFDHDCLAFQHTIQGVPSRHSIQLRPAVVAESLAQGSEPSQVGTAVPTQTSSYLPQFLEFVGAHGTCHRVVL